jgi:superfamily II DNA or RNA helicase
VSAEYEAFLAGKRRLAPDSGRRVDPADLGVHLAPFQAALTAWAVRKGRAALFAGTGLGKTRMQLTWARETGERVILLAPLGVTAQTVAEGEAIGVPAAYVRDQGEADALPAGVVAVSNYERLGKFDTSRFGAVVLDESSILKAFSGATKKALVSAFRDTPWRLCCTATPAPNDIEELCNHADFLGVMTAQEMRSTFFIADSRGEFMRYRLKGHARKAFYRWLASWAMTLDKPSDLSFDDTGYDLPPLRIEQVVVPTDYTPDGQLFAARLEGVTERAIVRHATLSARVDATAQLVEDEPDKLWLLWCGLNDESDALAGSLPGAVTVSGSDDPEEKAARLLAFAHGDIRTLVTKPSIAGFGLNFQACSRMAFVGIGDSYELYHQSIRRCWRFGQTRPVHAYVVVSDLEQAIYDNVLRKERQARGWAAGLVRETAEMGRAELFAGTSAADDYAPTAALTVPAWLKSEEDAACTA